MTPGGAEKNNEPPPPSSTQRKESEIAVVDLTSDEGDNNENQDIVIIDESITLDDRPSRSSSSSSSASALVIEISDSPCPTPQRASRSRPPIQHHHFHHPYTVGHLIPPPIPVQPPQPPSPPSDTLKCPICIESYVNVKQRGFKIVTTRCGHIFCDHCLKKAISGNGRKCPKCRKNVPKGPTGIIEIFDVC